MGRADEGCGHRWLNGEREVFRELGQRYQGRLVGQACDGQAWPGQVPWRLPTPPGGFAVTSRRDKSPGVGGWTMRQGPGQFEHLDGRGEGG